MKKLEAITQRLAALAPLSIKEADHAKLGYHLDVAVEPSGLVAAVAALDQEGFFIETITGVDWLGEQEAIRKDKAAKAAAKAKAAAEAAAAAGEEPPAPPPAEPEAPPAPDDMEAVYDFNHFSELCRVVVRARTPRDNPRLPTISHIYPAAHWHERETHDFFGIVFEGHPYLVPLLLPEDADFHPLRKDFTA